MYGPIRPPSEAYSLLVRVTKNCPWNKCEFCSVFKERKFERRPVEDVKKDILLARGVADQLQGWAEQGGFRLVDVARHHGVLWLQDDGVQSAFLQDSDSLIIETNQLVEILEFLLATFPTIERICTYARGQTIFRKKPEDLKRLGTNDLPEKTRRLEAASGSRPLARAHRPGDRR
jgi:hypothetical protein